MADCVNPQAIQQRNCQTVEQEIVKFEWMRNKIQFRVSCSFGSPKTVAPCNRFASITRAESIQTSQGGNQKYHITVLNRES